MQWSIRTVVGLVLAIVILPLIRVDAAADSWVEVRSPNFTVVANTSEGKARQMAWQFEQVRAALQTGWPWAKVSLDRPVVILAAKDESTMRALAPEYWEHGSNIKPVSVSTGSFDKMLIALRADVQEEAQGLQSYHLAYWDYGEVVLQRSFPSGLPFWMSRGLAAVVSNTIVEKDQVHFGRPLPYYVTQIRNRAVLTVPRLTAVKREDWVKLSADDRDAFDAQSWALVQFLIFGDPKSRLNDIAGLVLNGASSDEAIQKTFGSVDALDAAYRLYVHQGVFRYGRVAVAAGVEQGNYPTKALTAGEADAARAEFLAASNRPTEAQALLSEAKASAPTLAAPYDVEAKMALRQKDSAAERAALDKAVALNSQEYFTYYRLASLLAPSPDQRERAAQYAERATTLNPQFALAFATLGSLKLSAGDPTAIDALVKAAGLEPDVPAYRFNLAAALLRFDRRDEAVKVAQGGLSYARTDAERARFQQIIDGAARPSNATARAAAPSH